MEKRTKQSNDQTKAQKQEPVFLVKPASRLGGLDYLHVSLIALVVILVALAFVLSNFRGTVVCASGVLNGTCVTPVHNASQVRLAAGRVLAAYSTVNSTLALLPYYSFINSSTASYIANRGEWLVVIPYLDPFTNETFNMSMLLYDSNLTLAQPFIQTIGPRLYSNNSVVAPGTIELSGKSYCSYTPPIPVYLMVDPYAPGAVSSIMQAINLSRLNSKVNVSYDFLFSSYAISKYRTYGVNTTQLLGGYLACASAQPKFGQFIDNLSTVYSGEPLSAALLSQIASSSGLNMSSFNLCMANIAPVLVHQAQLASFYNVTATPSYIVNCKYSTIPQRLNSTVGYALKQLGS
jgi:hypothetical protein